MKLIRKLTTPILLAAGLLVLIAGIAILTQASSSKIANAQSPTPTPNAATSTRTDLGVSGTGHVFVTPDTAIASVGVEITAPTLAEATKEANDKMTAVLNAIKAQGVDAKDIQTSNYSVYPLTNQPKETETPKVTAYRVSNIVTVKIRKIDNVGQVLDAALAAGANSINSVIFTVDDPTQAQNEARTLAVKDAMAKAQTLATAAGVKVGKLFAISEVSGNVIPFFRGAVESAPVGGGAGPVETGSTEITVNVEMHFEIAQ